MPDLLSFAVIILLSLGFWSVFPRQLPEAWQGPAEQRMIDIGDWILTRYRKLPRIR